jgi:hypothetical protein
MIFPFMLSDGEFAMSEFGDLEDLMVLMFGMMYVRLLVLVVWFVVVCGGAVVIRYAHVHVPGVFAGAGSIWGHTTSPALAITGGGSIQVLQGFVFGVRIGVGREGPDSADLLVHGSLRH